MSAWSTSGDTGIGGLVRYFSYALNPIEINALGTGLFTSTVGLNYANLEIFVFNSIERTLPQYTRDTIWGTNNKWKFEPFGD
jgi:hypothetical protein